MGMDSIGSGNVSYADYNKDIDGGRKKNSFSPDEFTSRIKSDLTSQLGLSSDQQSKLDDILAKFQQSLDSNSQAQQGNPEPGKFKDLFDSLNSQINGILSPDQQSKFSSIQSQRASHAHHGHHHSESSQNETSKQQNNATIQNNDTGLDIKV